jgi:Glycosyl transferase family 2
MNNAVADSVAGRVGLSQQVCLLASVIVPAHNEEEVIGRLLRSLGDGARPGELEVIVVCNGCTDRTADRARAAGATVIELSAPGKAAALNHGDAVATAFPRFYVDADVVVTGGDILRMVRVLAAGAMLAVSARPRFEMAGASRVVRDYYRIWTRLPYLGEDHLGSGVIGLSEAGRARFDRFPDALADDLFLYHRFGPGERGTVDGTSVAVYPARTGRSLLTRRVRVYAGNAQLAGLGLAGPAPRAAGGPPGRPVGRLARWRAPGWLAAVFADPSLVGALPAFVTVSGLGMLLARRRVRRGDPAAWGRDASSRVPAAAP